MRLFDNYYRVSFFGKRFQDMDGCQYIYKEHPSIRLADFSQNLIVSFSIYINYLGTSRNYIWN